MSPSPVKSVFINYRRRDSSPVARWLAEAIRQNFGRASVFLDRAIQSGDEWPKRIEQGLKKSSVLLSVIGPEWLRAQDKFFKRRIDDPKDWVHREIVYALQHKIPIIPLLVLNGTLPEREALPKPLKPLRDYQAFELREDQSEADLRLLLDRLEELGLNRITPQVRYPEPVKEVPALSEEELKRVLKRLPGWKLDDTRSGPKGKKTELVRVYEFASFEDAIHYMSTASRYISYFDHHPDWENVWKTITVWLTTWDIGHKPSVYDLELAEYLDQLFLDYESKDKAAPKSFLAGRTSGASPRRRRVRASKKSGDRRAKR